MLDLNVFL